MCICFKVFLILAALVGFGHTEGSPWASYKNFTIEQNSYMFSMYDDGVLDAVGWQTAKERCAGAGAELWVPADGAEQRAVRGEVEQYAGTWGIWTGINDLDNTGTYKTPDGRPVSIDLEMWRAGQPYSYEGRWRCAALGTSYLMFLNDCATSHHLYLCRLPAASPPASTTPPSEHNQPCVYCSPQEEIDNIIRLKYEESEEMNIYFKLHRMPATWDDAHSRCLQEGGQLASPIDEKFFNLMIEIMKIEGVSCGVHTGFQDRFAPGHFSSVEGISLEELEVPWRSGQCPEPEPSRRWLVLRPTKEMELVGRDGAYPFICYIINNNATRADKNCVCNGGYKRDDRTGSYYKIYSNVASWSEAAARCARDDAHLAVANSAAEAGALGELVAARGAAGALVGIARWSEPKRWLTVHGQTLQAAGFSRWGVGQPEPSLADGDSRCCGAISSTGLYRDISCEQKTIFICEKFRLRRDVVEDILKINN